MKIAGFGNSSGSRYWRLEDPFAYLRKLGHEAHVVEDEGINDSVCTWADIMVLQGCVDMEGIACARAYQHERGLKLVVEVDDALEISEDNPHVIEHKISNAPAIITKTIGIADLVTCTVPYLQTQLSKLNKNVVVLPNYLDMKRWDLPNYTNDSSEVRIGWAGSATHVNDLKLIVEPLKQIMKEHPEVKLIIMGDQRIADLFKGYNVETILGVAFEAYPARLHGLRLDIGIAPLLTNAFNRGKSNIKFLEYSICSVPSVVSPIAYKDSATGYICESPAEWYGSLKNLVINKKEREEMGKDAYTYVKENYDLEQKITLWEKAYKALLT